LILLNDGGCKSPLWIIGAYGYLSDGYEPGKIKNNYIYLCLVHTKNIKPGWMDSVRKIV